MIKRFVVLRLFLFVLPLGAQNPDYARQVVEQLCSDEMAGRGYVKNGAQKAADYIASEFSQAGLKAFSSGYFQEFGFPAVAFPYPITLTIDQEERIPGVDFISGPGCTAINGVFDLVFADSVTLDDPVEFRKFEKHAFYRSMIVVDGIVPQRLKHPERFEKIKTNGYKSRGIVYMNQKKLTWGVATQWDAVPTLYFLQEKLKRHHSKIKINLQPEIIAFQAKNIIGYQRGTKYPDSFMVITAHYDHLGMFGKDAIFRGANDNASGVAMMLDMIQHYAKNPPEYSIAYMAFTGEEAGLFGSYYYTQNPLFPLKQIVMLINLDLMGTGDEGLTAVNGEVFRERFNELVLINLTENYLPEIKARGKASNSDHYYFSENGVCAFFFYLMGKYPAYHDVYDTPEVLTFSRYAEAFKLITTFVNEQMK